MDSTILESLIDHVVLPLKLPGKQESNITQISDILLDRSFSSSRVFRDQMSNELSENSWENWDSIRRSLQTSSLLNAGGKLNRRSLIAEFQNLGKNDILILHIVEQNAILLIRQQNSAQESSVIFEAFEASPLSESVLAAKNSLVWDFPGCAASISQKEFSEPTFQHELAVFLEQASTESVKRFAARANKAGSFAFETRNTADPGLIIQVLMTLLEVNGSRVFPPMVRKRVRDDVCWTEGAEKPWRRSPMWLGLRVGIQLHLVNLFGSEVGRVHYKFFICVWLARLIDESLNQLVPESLVHLKSKLSRRLVKLQGDQDRATPAIRPIYEDMFTIWAPAFQKTLRAAVQRVELSWSSIKKSMTRSIPRLPRYPMPEDLRLSLPNSSPYLQEVTEFYKLQFSFPHRYPTDYNVTSATGKSYKRFIKQYTELSEMEASVENLDFEVPSSTSGLEECCIQLSAQIESYLNAVAGAYDSNAEQFSIKILTAMELFMWMDKCAIGLFSLLKDFDTGFPCEILDTLQLVRATDMQRAQKIKDHLKTRREACKSPRMSIFSALQPGCFAEGYYDLSPELQQLHSLIEAEAEEDRTEKEHEWKQMSTEYEDLVKQIDESLCLYTMDNDISRVTGRPEHDQRRCKRCFLQRQSRKYKIEIHEHPLPANDVQAKAVVFELGCHEGFLAYRDAGWRILILCFPPTNQILGQEPKLLIEDYSELEAHMPPNTCNVSLASSTKSFLHTHYAKVPFPCTLEDICRPNGLKLGYYDRLTKTWPSCITQRPSFAHHLGMLLPTSSPFSGFQSMPDFGAGSEGPSSYKTVTSSSSCFAGLNVHEFMSFQSTAAGMHRRWINLLSELGSSSLNFSAEAVTILVSRLALELGSSEDGDYLGIVHAVFTDVSFCERLIDQISSRLEAVSSNWREVYCMDMLITLIVRLFNLAPSQLVLGKALALLERAREITHDWLQSLRVEKQKAVDHETAKRSSRYALLSSLLHRRTFAILSNTSPILSSADVQSWLESSITLQDNLHNDPATLSISIRNSLIRDTKMTYQLRCLLQDSIAVNPQGFVAAMTTVWPEPEGEGATARSFSSLEFLQGNQRHWVKTTVAATDQSRQQTLHYHLLEGHLLIDGQAIGKLPAEHRGAVVLRNLFGEQSLRTWPSPLTGMTYMLAIPMYGNQIHIGFRKGQLFVRAVNNHTALEYIPPEIFVKDASNFDLPARLVENVVHWLDLKSGIMEMRKKPNIWTRSPGNWCIDFQSRRGYRFENSLICPNSRLYKRVVDVFQHFEKPENVLLSQPESRSIVAELRRLELIFFINKDGLLQSPQLQSEIDPNQDAGTWYGLYSKLVLRKMRNPKERSIIVPMGVLSHSRQGMHPAIFLSNEGYYTQFTINDVLGRLDCAIDPRILYLKAMLHAYTSAFVPDPLLRRTGTEEACAILDAGFCKPYQPLSKLPHRSLVSIAKLSPKRQYYPEDLKVMQRVSWDPDLPQMTQYEGFNLIVDSIIRQSEQLSVFALQKTVLGDLAPVGNNHLVDRALRKSLRYQRCSLGDSDSTAEDIPYIARDRCRESPGRFNVFESVSLINRGSELPTTQRLAEILSSWPQIQGYNGQDLVAPRTDNEHVPILQGDLQEHIFDKLLLSDRLAVSLAENWGSLVNLCCSCGEQDKYRLQFLFAVMSFRNDISMEIIRTLIAFSVFEDLKLVSRPSWNSYDNFRLFAVPSHQNLMRLMEPYIVPYSGDIRSTFQNILSSKQRKKLEAVESNYYQQSEERCKDVASFLLKQWPCPQLTLEGIGESTRIDIDAFMKILHPEWLRFYKNYELSIHIQEVQKILERHHPKRGSQMPKPAIEAERLIHPGRSRGGIFPNLQTLLCKKGPKMGLEDSKARTEYDNKSRDLQTNPRVENALLPEIVELQRIIQGFANSKSIVRQQYSKDLTQSLNALKEIKAVAEQKEVLPSHKKLAAEVLQAREAMIEIFSQICKSFENGDPSVFWLKAGGLWPMISPISLLEQLRSTCTPAYGSLMKENLVKYALSISNLQRLIRMEGVKGDEKRLAEELENVGHTNWSPSKNLDWLLIELDANILIRPTQIDVANATISPYSKKNSVLQLNMGQGKTSIIMPMVAAVLADSKSLVRVVVPKPLLLQTAQLMQARLGGLVGRHLRHVPFSRRTPTSLNVLQNFFNIHKEVQRDSGVMIALPEHILSFQLSGQQRLLDNRLSEATSMLKVQAWTRKFCRDVLDECDISLAVKTQLIYPSGTQKTVDGHPHRWETAEALLGLVQSHLPNLRREFPRSIEVVPRKLGFPIVHFLRKDVEDALISRLVQDVSSEKSSVLPMKECSQIEQVSIMQFISSSKVSESVMEVINSIFPDKPAAKKTVFLLRGLFVNRILLLTLKKRWNVQYGIHPGRDPWAVPFLAKGVASETSDFGHPDVGVILTILAFYYEGLKLSQLRECLVNCLKSDDPSSEYHRWTESSAQLPDTLRQWNAINVDDESQLTELFSHLRHNITVIEYFLNSFVFPKFAKQFQHKLLAAGWDIPLSAHSPQNSRKEGKEGKLSLTTGFSGTNDNRFLLPGTITQSDLATLSYTNAEVLATILQYRNRQYVRASDKFGRRFSERGLLIDLYERKIPILIDAGANILELSNQALVKTWLEIYKEAPAAIYFNHENKPIVHYRQGHEVPLIGTPYAENLHNCLVYLDESHCRGTDLKLPADARGALTLGLGQTKDHTMQAAMRMRKLATTQSVVFYSPPEVHQSILDTLKKKAGDSLTSHDVIIWLLENTCEGIEQLQPLYFSQGVDFCKRVQAGIDNPDLLIDSNQLDTYLALIRSNERQTIETLYNPRPPPQTASTIETWSPELAAFMKELKRRKKGFQDTGSAVGGAALQEVEMEREVEVAHEVENVREVQNPNQYQPLAFPGLHRDIHSYATTGRLPAGSISYELAFATMRRTSIGQKHGINTDSAKLLVSSEFLRTVNLPPRRKALDNFQRNVNWVLWSTETETALIVIPEEAEHLIPILRKANTPTHLLTYSAVVTRKMLHFNKLTFYGVPNIPERWEAPTWLRIELGIFAGQLYFPFEDYGPLLSFLGFEEPDMECETGKIIQIDGAGSSTGTDLEVADGQGSGEGSEEEVMNGISTQVKKTKKSFTKKPLTFLQDWLAMRRRGQDFTHTPMGYVCSGKPLFESHPFFTKLQ